MTQEFAATIEGSMVRTVAESDLSELTAEAIDAALDNLPLPIFSMLRKFYRSAQSVKDYYYTKKVLRYLREFSDVPVEQRREQIDKMRDIPGEQEKFGAHICLVLDRLNDLDKASLMGKVSRAFLLGRISVEQLKSLNFAIDAVDPRLLCLLAEFVRHARPLSGLAWEQQSLVSCGLMAIRLRLEKNDPISQRVGHTRDFAARDGEYVTSIELNYEVTATGHLLVRTCLS